MTPQASFMAVAPITPGREDELRKLLASMNHRPGVADPDNPLVPFGRLAGVHFARFVILDDATLDDVTAHGVPRVDHRPSLAFLADFDGPVDAFLDDLLPHRWFRIAARLRSLRGLRRRKRTEMAGAVRYLASVGG